MNIPVTKPSENNQLQEEPITQRDEPLIHDLEAPLHQGDTYVGVGTSMENKIPSE